MNATTRAVLLATAIAAAAPAAAIASASDNIDSKAPEQKQEPETKDFPWGILGVLGALGVFGLKGRGVYRKGAPRG